MGIRILMYHGIYKSDKEIFSKRREWIDAKCFEDHCRILTDNNINVISMNEYKDYFINGNSDKQAIVLTFDDAPLCQIKYALPILLKYNLKASFYIPVSWLNRPNRMSETDVKELHKSGMEIGSHSFTHSDLSILNESKVHKELKDSRIYLEQLTGSMVNHFSNPYGYTYEFLNNMYLENGYETVVSTKCGVNDLSTNIFDLYRIGIYNHTLSNTFKKLLSQKYFIQYKFIEYSRKFLIKVMGRNFQRKLNFIMQKSQNGFRK